MASLLFIRLQILFISFFQTQPSEFDLNRYESQVISNPLQVFENLTVELEENQGISPITKGKIQSLRGKLLYDFGLFKEATATLYEAEILLKGSGCQPCLAINHNYLGELYFKVKGPKEALQRHQQALEIFESLDDKVEIAKTYGFIGTMYEKQGKAELAIQTQNYALNLFKNEPPKEVAAFLFENLGSIYEDLGKFDSSRFYFSKAMSLHLALNDSIHLPGNYNNLADIERKTGNYQEALALSEKAATISIQLENLYQEKSALVDISKTYAAMGRDSLAYQTLEMARRLDKEIFSTETARQLSIQEAQYGFQQQIAKIKQLEQKAQFDAQFRALLIFLLLLFISLGFLVINRQKLKIRSSKALIQQKEKLIQMKEKLIATEKENINLLEARMSLEVESQNKALTAQTVHLLEKNQMLEEIRQKLRKTLEVEAKDQKKWIRNLIKQIDYNFSQDTDWEDFKNNFEKVHQDFFKSITKNEIELTPSEMKLASLIRMNLNSKEIASTLGISPESLRISRYRLRKKLKLQKGESLQNYILCI